MSFGIIVKKYEHTNRAFGGWDTPKGKYISSKAQYMNEMAKGGFVPKEEYDARLAKADEKRIKESYNGLSGKANDLVRSVHKDKNGKIQLSDRQILAMKEIGCKFNIDRSSKWVTSYDRSKGGYDAT